MASRNFNLMERKGQVPKRLRNEVENGKYQPRDAVPGSTWTWVCIREGFPEEVAFELPMATVSGMECFLGTKLWRD